MSNILKEKHNKGQSTETIIGIIVVIAVVVAGAAYFMTQGGEEGGEPNGGDETGVLHAEDMKLGIIFPLSGDLGWIGQQCMLGTNVAKRELEDLRGETFTTTKGDTRADPSEASVALDKLLGDDVYAAFGPCSFSIRALMDTFQSEKLATSIIGDTPWLDDKGGEYVYRGWISSTSTTVGAVQFLLEEVDEEDWEGNFAVDTISIIGSDDTAGADHTLLVKRAAECYGIEVLERVLVPPGKATYASTVSKVLEKDPEAISISAGTADSWTLTKNVIEAGFHGPLLESSGDQMNPTFFNLAEPKSYIDNVYSFGTTVVGGSSKTREKIVEYGEDPDLMDVGPGYDMTVIALLALEAAEVPEDASLMEIRQAIADNWRYVTNPPGVTVSTLEEGLTALEEGKDIDWLGFFGERNYDEYGEHWPVMNINSYAPEGADNYEEGVYVGAATPSRELLEEAADCVREKRAEGE